MEFIIHNAGSCTCLEVTDKSFIIESEQDAVDLAALCGENEASGLLVNSWNLDGKFFDLTTGLAGAVLQKFSNYRLTFAAVVPADKMTGRFREMAIELNRGRQFRVLTERDEAEKWIACGS
jgi:PadR family transcriptional regulator AphA